MDYKGPLYTGMCLALVLCARNISGKYGFVCLGTGIISGYYAFERYIEQYNVQYSLFLLKNFYSFDEYAMKGIKTGDYRYFRQLIPEKKSLSEIKSETDFRLLIR